jgi:glycosyltransferase involved in cell wall biosynthesis
MPTIVYVAPFGLGAKTTVWARTLPLAQQMVRRGWQASILIPPWDTPEDAGKRTEVDGVELVHVTLSGGILAVVARLVRELDQRQPQIVHIVKPRAHAGLVQWWLWRRRRWRRSTPTIVLDVDDWEQAWAAINHYGWPVARFLAWQEEWGLRHADGITAASRWLVERTQHYSPQTPVCYLPNGVVLSDQPPAQRATHPATPRVLLFSRFVEVSPAWLAAFWQALAGQVPTALLLVAGSAFTPGREALFQAAMTQLDPGAAERVQWLGYVPRETLAAHYATVDCAIFPAAEEPLQQAKCSVRLATTLLHGVPVVASAVGEQAAYGAEGAARLVAPTAVPGEFAQAVVDLLHAPAEQRAMVQRARQRLATRYTWDQLGDQLATFYARWIS